MQARTLLLKTTALALLAAPTYTQDIHPTYLRFTDHRNVIRDPIPGLPQGAYGQDHWKDNTNPCDGDAADDGDNRYPVAYKPGDRMVIDRVEFCNATVDPAIWSLPLSQVRGTGSDGNLFVGIPAQTGSVLYATSMQGLGVLADKARFFNPYTITWEIAYYHIATGQHIVDPAGTTDNRVYVSYADAGVGLFESLMHVSCGAADGLKIQSLTEKKAAFDKIWLRLEDLSLARKPLDGDNTDDGAVLTYWGPSATAGAGFTVQDLIGNGWGKCGAWGPFLAECCALQGISVDVNSVTPTSPDVGMTVKNASFPGLVCSNLSYPYWAADTINGTGIAAHGNPTPALAHKMFINHCICRFDSKIYDPSYGYTPASKLAWEDHSLHSVARAANGCQAHPFQGAYARLQLTGQLDLTWPSGW